MMRFISALMVVGTTMAIQNPNLGQTGFVTTMIEYAPNDNNCQTAVAITYQPTGVCIAALKQTSNNNVYPSVTPVTQTAGTLSTTTATYQSYIYSVSSSNAVFISYYSDSSCQTLVTATLSGGGTQAAGDTPVVAQSCALVGSALTAPFNGGGGWEYTTMPFTFSATSAPTLGNVPTSVYNTYANSVGTGSTTASCSGLPTQVTIQNIAISQMAPFSSGNTCAKTACSSVTLNGQLNGVASPSLSTQNGINVNVMAQNLCTVPTVSSQSGYVLRNYYTDASCSSLDRVDQFQTNVCQPYGAGNVAPSGLALTYTSTNALSNTAGTQQAQVAGQNGNVNPEGLLPTQGSIVITFAYTSPGTWSSSTSNGVTTWSYTASSGTTTNVYTTNYATSTCGSSSVLVVRPDTYNLVGSSAPTCSISTTYIGSQSQWTPLSLTYNVYASGAYAPVASYTQSTNSWTIAFSTSVSTTNSGVSTTTVTLTTNPTTQVQKFYATQNDCMSGNMVNLGWAQYTNIANGNVAVSTPACIGASSTNGGNPARNLANLNMCSFPTVSTATSTSVNYLMVQQFETSTCTTGSLGYYYIQLNTCHFVSGSNQVSVQYTLQAQTSSTTTIYNIIQQYYLSTSSPALTAPTCTVTGTNTLAGSNIFGTTGTSTVATTTTPIVATTGICMPSGTSYAQFSITAQPTTVSGVLSSYSTASYATSAACTSAYASTAPTTIGTGSLVQLYVPSSTCNQVMWQQSYQSTTASSGSPAVPAALTPGALYSNNILTLDSATYGNSVSTGITNGQVTNVGTPAALPFYSQVTMVGCTNTAATATTTACFTISQVYTGLTVAQATSTVFINYLKGAVQNLLLVGNPTTTSATYNIVQLISATAVSGSTNQITLVYNVQLPSAIYGTALSTTTPWANNPFSASNAGTTMASYFNAATTYSNLVGGGNLYSTLTIASTAVTSSGCITTTINTVSTVATTQTIGTNTGSNACFADSEVVTMENGSSKSIAEVQIGDRILSADVQGKTSFSDVVYVPHSANAIEATFVLLTTETGRNVKMTTNHILPAGQCESAMSVRRADAVSVGDCVMTVDGIEKVMDMVTMQGKGIYTVVTNKEYIVVNGIVATPFGGVNPTLANMYYNLHRMMYAFMPQALMSSQSVMQQVMDKFASLIL